MRSEYSEAFRRYMQAQPKAIAYTERLQAENPADGQWIVFAATLMAISALAVTLLA